jgi:hypothetical protein
MYEKCGEEKTSCDEFLELVRFGLDSLSTVLFLIFQKSPGVSSFNSTSWTFSRLDSVCPDSVREKQTGNAVRIVGVCGVS